MTILRAKIKSSSLSAKIIEPIDAPVETNIDTNMRYQASSLSPFLETKRSWFLPIDLSKIKNIFNLPNPTKYGQSLFRNRQTEQIIPLFFKGNESADAQLQTTVYSVETEGIKCSDGGPYCETFFTYENEFGDVVSDSIKSNGEIADSITFCSSSVPVITSTVTNGCASCVPPLVTVFDTKCNILDPSISANNQILYIDNGKKYQLLSSRNESKNFGWQPVSNEELYPHVERSDFDSFDFPQVTIRGTRKIPTSSADTLCGPVTYTGYTYDRLNYNWFFGENAGMSFEPIQSGGTPTPLSGAMESQEGVSSISNQEGQLLFYTNGETVYTSGNTIMSNGTGLSSSGTSTQSSIIIPQPDSNKYYIFTTDFNGSPNGFEYSIVNMDLQGGAGQIEAKNIKLINTSLTEKVTACSHSTEDAYWVITHTSGDTSYYSYKVSSTGLSGPIITNIGSTHNTARGYMKTSPDCTKLISVLYDEDIIDIFDFEASAGTLSNFVSITGKTFDVGPYGLEFSSDSSKFYVSEGAGEKIYQYNLSYTAATDILANEIEVGYISGSSLGSLQMGADERIYTADLGKSYLHSINRPNGLGVQCDFQENAFNLSTTPSSAVTTNFSNWGLPNIITDKAISCDRYVYITPLNRIGFGLNLLVNNVNNVVIPKKLSYYGEIYKYDQGVAKFTPSALQTFTIPYENLSGNTVNTIIVASEDIGEGEFIIKSYWDYNVNTLIAKQQNIRLNTLNTYKRGELYGLYTPETDWYFINMLEASKPTFNSSVAPNIGGINSLVVQTQFTQSGKTDYFMNSLSDPIVSYNGAVLAKNIEYSAFTGGLSGSPKPFIRLLFDPLDRQILTYAYVDDGKSNDLFADLYTVSSTISSGATGTQSETDRVFYNINQNKYEFYMVNVPATAIVLSINGSVLAVGVEYGQSGSDPRRIILENDINHDDIIEAFYTPTNAIMGGISSNKPIISWSIVTEPKNNSGVFTIEVADEEDTTFTNVLYSVEVSYVINQKTYSSIITLTNAKAGDKFIYRIKNEKFYTPIIGEIIYSVSYSDTVPIEILTNSGISY
jgi:hypothetical protein